MTLRKRLTATFTGALALVLTLACLALSLSARRNAYREATTRLTDAAAGVQGELLLTEHDSPQAILSEAAGAWTAAGLRVTIQDANGRTLASAGTPARFARALQATRRAGGLEIVAALDGQPIEAALRRETLAVVGVSLLGALAALIGSELLVGRALAPIERLARQARASSGDLRLESPSGDAELVELVSTLNAFLARTQEQSEARRLFHAAAAHELRTPLHILSGTIELALSRPRTPSEHRAALLALDAQATILRRLTETLLTLSRLESAPQSVPETVNIVPVIEKILQGLKEIVERKGLSLENSLPESWTVQASPEEIEIVLRNLIENAVRHAPHGGAVRLSRSGEFLSLWNAAAPLSPEEMSRLGEPFYRPDAARSRTHGDAGGSGLGLAICARLLARSGARWSLSCESGGFEVRIGWKP